MLSYSIRELVIFMATRRGVDRRLGRLVDVEAFRSAARSHLPKIIFDHIEGGAGNETTVRANESAFDEWTFRPRVLVDVSSRCTEIALFGDQLGMPVLLAPTGMAGFTSPHGEVAALRAAEAFGTRLVVSTAASHSFEELGAVSHQRHWFQLYPWGDRALMSELMARAMQGGLGVLCVTVDMPVTGIRRRDRRNSFSAPPRITLQSAADIVGHPAWLAKYLWHRRYSMRNLTTSTSKAIPPANQFASLFNPQMDWAELEWIRSRWAGPMLIKGLTHPADAELALAVGVDGVIVSNHGGRQLDGVLASLSALPMVAAQVNGRVPVLVDGGVRSGMDLAKALCLGASACLIGRPYLYGLAIAGQRGVEAVLRVLREELDSSLALLGCARASDLNREFLGAVAR